MEDETLSTLRGRSCWWWLVCADLDCQNARAIALVPYLIRFGLDARRSRVERAVRCEQCGRLGAHLEHPLRGCYPRGKMLFPEIRGIWRFVDFY